LAGFNAIAHNLLIVIFHSSYTFWTTLYFVLSHIRSEGTWELDPVTDALS